MCSHQYLEEVETVVLWESWKTELQPGESAFEKTSPDVAGIEVDLLLLLHISKKSFEASHHWGPSDGQINVVDMKKKNTTVFVPS